MRQKKVTYTLRAKNTPQKLMCIGESQNHPRKRSKLRTAVEVAGVLALAAGLLYGTCVVFDSEEEPTDYTEERR